MKELEPERLPEEVESDQEIPEEIEALSDEDLEEVAGGWDNGSGGG